MFKSQWLVGVTAVCAAFACGLLVAHAQEKKQDYEKKVKEGDVPAPALAALKKLAGGAAFTEFAEEVEHGCKYYEGSWKGPDGNIDGLVTEAGDIVELEESIPVEKVPAGVRAAAEKEAGKDAKVRWERKTVYLYEIHYKKDNKGQELIFGADARRFHENGNVGKEAEMDNDEDD